MFVKTVLASAVAISLLVTGGQDDGAKTKKDKLSGIKCVINGKAAAKQGTATKYKDGEVYFCCGNCKKKFEADPSKFEVKANHQLAATGQYVQTGCPMSGGKVNKEQTAKVGGVEVGFCCGNCKGKVANAADLEAKAKLVFSNKAFKNAYAVAKNDDDKKAKSDKVDLSKVKCMMMPKKSVNADFAVDYMGGQVYFCCKGCAGKFAKDKENAKWVHKANHQLVRTGQFVQKTCPFSGGPIDKAQTTKVNGVEVGFCCGNCKGKVETAKKEKKGAVKMVFSKESFKKNFAKKAEEKKTQ